MTISVFLADDHAVVRDGLRVLLEAEKDIQVIGDASNGREALRHIKRNSIDIVVMDIAMPELNGIAATEQICAASPKTRVIILSMYATTEHIYRAVQAGARGYLLKESAGQEVVQAIRTVNQGNRYFSRRISDMVIDDYMLLRESTTKQSPIELLSSRELEVMQMVADGKSSAEIAEVLYISPKTVETYRSRIMSKLGIRDITGLVKFAIQHGLTPIEHARRD